MSLVMVAVAQVNARDYRPFWMPEIAHEFVAPWWSTLFYALAGILGLGAIGAALPPPKEDEEPVPTETSEKPRLHAPHLSFTDRLRARLREFRTNQPSITVDAVLSELEKSESQVAIRPRPMAWIAISLVAFAVFGLLLFDFPVLLSVIAVLFFHEAGHFVAMRLFGYRDVTMFFIPLFGAAVLGRKENSQGWQRAVIVLAGPLPGLALAWALLPIYLSHQETWLGVTVFLLIVLNAINLAPMFPLDGGRFLNEILFSRHPWLEIIFRTVTAIGLVLVGLLVRSWVLTIFGMIVLLGAWFTTKIIRATISMRQKLPAMAFERTHRIPVEIAEPLIEEVRAHLASTDVKTVAAAVRQVWERLNSRPPGWLASIMLLALYVLAVGSIIVMPVVFSLLILDGVLPPPQSGFGAQFFAGFEHGVNRE